MNYIRTADWKTEKHVPVIHAPDRIKSGEPVEITVTVGEETPHPNQPDHYIAWIELYYVPKGGNTVFPIGRAEFAAHGEVKVWTEPRATFTAKLPRSGKLVALSLCNIHGLWMSERDIEVE